MTITAPHSVAEITVFVHLLKYQQGTRIVSQQFNTNSTTHVQQYYRLKSLSKQSHNLYGLYQ